MDAEASDAQAWDKFRAHHAHVANNVSELTEVIATATEVLLKHGQVFQRYEDRKEIAGNKRA